MSHFDQTPKSIEYLYYVKVWSILMYENKRNMYLLQKRYLRTLYIRNNN